MSNNEEDFNKFSTKKHKNDKLVKKLEETWIKLNNDKSGSIKTSLYGSEASTSLVDTVEFQATISHRPKIIRDRSESKELSSKKVVKFSEISKVHNLNPAVFQSLMALILMILTPNFTLYTNYWIKTMSEVEQQPPMPFISQLKHIWNPMNIDFAFGFGIIFAYSLFQLVLMVIVPGKTVYGPRTIRGHIPKYKDNGFKCYIISLLVFCSIELYLWSFYRHLNVGIVATKFISLNYCLIIFGLFFCLFLFVKGNYFTSSPDNGSSGNFLFDYYWGLELYPRVFDIDIKVFTNCRFGMTAWPLLILCFLRESLFTGNIHYGTVVNVLLQMLYITKFFWWEAGYYSTLDIILDRAGYYICWGCLVFVPCFYTITSHLISQTAVYYPYVWFIALVFGLFSLTINYLADYQKQVFRANKGNLLIWDKPAIFIEAYYTDYNGNVHPSLLLCSGYWGLARHFHYLPELTLALSWSLAAGPIHPLVLSYFIFLLVLLLHRVERDDRKCTAKYGDYYEHYKVLVPYKIIPRVY